MQTLKRLFYKLQMWDGFFSAPLGMLIFLGAGYLGQYWFNGEVGFFDPSYLQGALMACSILVTFSFAAQVGWYMGMRGLFRYFYGKEIKEDFKNSPTWFKILFALSPYLVYLILVTIIFRTVLGK